MQQAPRSHSPDLKYRPDIDGLRAVAVSSVVLYHAWPKRIVGGFVGVDVFFVISGYLISLIIMSELEQGRFSIVDFYSRRIRRIFPALLAVLAVTLAFAWYIMLHAEFRQLGKHVAAGSLFMSNLVLWSESGYFDNLAITKPLLHLWSLGVEEQFYLFWPLLLWVVFRWRFRFITVISVIFLASMAYNVLTVGSDPTAAFYSPLTRFWELMSGGIAAYLHEHVRPWSRIGKELSSLGGAGLLLLAFVIISPQDPFPGWWALLPTGGAFLLIMAGPNAIINRRALSLKPAVALGLISYPLYLWHWPLLSFGYIISGGRPRAEVKFALVLAALLLALVTYRWLELPLRRLANRPRLVGALCIGMIIVATLGALADAGAIRERIDTHGADIYLDAMNDTDFPGRTFVPFRFEGVVFQKLTSRSPGLTIFLGDSVVQQYGPYVEQELAKRPAAYHSVIFATVGGCPPIKHTLRLPFIQFPLCEKTVDAAYDLADSPEVGTVVLGASWYVYFTDRSQDLWFDTGTRREQFPDADALRNGYASLEDSIATLEKHGKRVYLILQPPMGPAFDPANMITGSRFTGIRPIAPIENVSLDKFNQRYSAERDALLKIAAETGAHVIEPSDYLCRNNICPVLGEDGTPVYTDGIHMRPAYVRRAARYLQQTIAEP